MNESTVPEPPLALPWTAWGLRSLESLIAWQQQAWQQWFRVFSAFTPAGWLPLDPVNAAESAGALEAAGEAARQRTREAVKAASRRAAHASEHPRADAGARRPRRGAKAVGGRSKRRPA